MAENVITKEQVKKIAQLSKLELSESEIVNFAELFTQTLKYINVLDELNTQDYEPTFQVTGLINVFMQENQNKATLSQSEALSNATKVINNLFATGAVFDRV